MLDGSEDGKITQDDPQSHKIPPPLLYILALEVTSCLIMPDASEDGKVAAEGPQNYKMPLPILYILTCEAGPWPTDTR